MCLSVLLTVGLLPSAQSTEYLHVMGGFFKGSEHPDLKAQYRAAYAAGFVNGMSVAAMVLNGGDTPKEPEWLAACVSEMTTTHSRDHAQRCSGQACGGIWE